jgi:hypothetical protein
MKKSMNDAGEMQKYTGPDWVFEMSGNEFRWRDKSEELKRAVDVLWIAVESDVAYLREFVKKKPLDINEYDSQKSVINIAVFLAGLSIENLLKGILIITNPEYIKSGKIRGELIQSHNLIDLTKELNIKLTENEKAFCEISSEAISGFGRYPIPKNISKMKSRITIKLTIKSVFDEFYNRLIIELTSRSNYK